MRMFRAHQVAACWVTLLLGCGKTTPPSAPDAGVERTPASASSVAPASNAALAPSAGLGASGGVLPHESSSSDDDSFRLPAVPRIVAIGDIHGDVQAARAVLKLGGAIDDAGAWVGGKLVVVQTGDQLDRGDDEPEILALFERLRTQAKAADGALIALNGNHEVMNVQGDFRYVTPDGFHDFLGAQSPARLATLLAQLPAGRRGRAAAFLPGGAVAKRLSVQPVVEQVGDSVFVHGGVLEAHVRYGLGRINREVREWMVGAPTEPAPLSVTNERAPIWVRDYSDGDPSSAACAELGRVLSALSAKRLIIGHTVQKEGINSACAGKVWRIDVGLSRFYGGKPSALEIRGDQVRVLEAAPAAH